MHVIWLTTAAEHIEFGSEADDDEGPGVWAVDNVVVESDKLNWDHTGLLLSGYKPGRYKVNYYSKRDPGQTWCGYVQVIEDTPPIPASQSCDPGDTGIAPPQSPMFMRGESGKEYRNGDNVTVESDSDLAELENLKLISTYAERTGTKKVRESKKSSAYHMPKYEWKYGENAIGARQEHSSATISSENKIEIYYEGKEIAAIKPSNRDDEAEDGLESLDISRYIDREQPGKYEIKVTNILSNKTCQLVTRQKRTVKKTDVDERKETITFTIEVK